MSVSQLDGDLRRHAHALLLVPHTRRGGRDVRLTEIVAMVATAPSARAARGPPSAITMVVRGGTHGGATEEKNGEEGHDAAGHGGVGALERRECEGDESRPGEADPGEPGKGDRDCLSERGDGQGAGHQPGRTGESVRAGFTAGGGHEGAEQAARGHRGEGGPDE
jgi:hypothetical protein